MCAREWNQKQFCPIWAVLKPIGQVKIQFWAFSISSWAIKKRFLSFIPCFQQKHSWTEKLAYINWANSKLLRNFHAGRFRACGMHCIILYCLQCVHNNRPFAALLGEVLPFVQCINEHNYGRKFKTQGCLHFIRLHKHVAQPQYGF